MVVPQNNPEPMLFSLSVPSLGCGFLSQGYKMVSGALAITVPKAGERGEGALSAFSHGGHVHFFTLLVTCLLRFQLDFIL